VNEKDKRKGDKRKKAKNNKKASRFGTYFMASFLVFKRSSDESEGVHTILCLNTFFPITTYLLNYLRLHIQFKTKNKFKKYEVFSLVVFV